MLQAPRSKIYVAPIDPRGKLLGEGVRGRGESERHAVIACIGVQTLPQPERVQTSAKWGCRKPVRAEPEDARATPRDTKADRRRIKELARELRPKEKALAEAAAFWILSKKLDGIFPKDKDEDV